MMLLDVSVCLLAGVWACGAVARAYLAVARTYFADSHVADL
jgi:hypothetical protein